MSGHMGWSRLFQVAIEAQKVGPAAEEGGSSSSARRDGGTRKTNPRSPPPSPPSLRPTQSPPLCVDQPVSRLRIQTTVSEPWSTIAPGNAVEDINQYLIHSCGGLHQHCRPLA